MTHSDDQGLVLPPRLAPTQVVIVPIPKPTEEILAAAEKIKESLIKHKISVEIDRDEKKRPGFKFAEYEMKGIPVRIGIGQRDLDNHVVEVARRDTKEKFSVPLDGIETYIEDLLNEIQDNLYNRAMAFREDRITIVNDYEEFKRILNDKGGFVYAHWDGTTETELKIKEETKATIRCIPIDNPQEEGICVYSGKPSKERVLFAKAY